MNKTISKIIVIVFSVVLVILGIYNIFNNTEFWKLTITNILTLGVAIIITYYMTQKTNEERRKKDIVGKILDRLYVLITDSRMCEISSRQDIDFVLINIRTISNKITCLKDFSESLNYAQEINQMESLFSEYEDFVSDHVEDVEYLTKSKKQLSNKIALIDNKCDMILIKINM